MSLSFWVWPVFVLDSEHKKSHCFSQIPIHINPTSKTEVGISIEIQTEEEISADELEQIMIKKSALVQQKKVRNITVT